MALQKSFEVSKGLVASSAYIHVECVTVVRKEKSGATVHVYASAESTEEPVQVRCYDFDYNPEGENAVKQAYEHLKTLPEFEGAVDC